MFGFCDLDTEKRENRRERREGRRKRRERKRRGRRGSELKEQRREWRGRGAPPPRPVFLGSLAADYKMGEKEELNFEFKLMEDGCVVEVAGKVVMVVAGMCAAISNQKTKVKKLKRKSNKTKE